jgi:histidinol-phosphate/aromatic aminotransferase/cobyric acid decarboxylase-like protein
MMPITGMAAAGASLQAKYVIPERRKLIGDVREDTFSFMEKNNYSYVKSMSNCFMVDCKRDPRTVIDAMRKENVFIGRVWPSWPTHVRISIGTQDEMNKFKSAFKKVMA